MLLFLAGITVSLLTFSNGLSCYRCWKGSDAMKNVTAKGYSFTNVAYNDNCETSPSDKDTSCTHACHEVITRIDLERFVIRGCADTLLKAEQWTKLKISADKIIETCHESNIGAESSITQTSGRSCFCKSDNCNGKKWEDMEPNTSFNLVSPNFWIFCSVVMCMFLR